MRKRVKVGAPKVVTASSVPTIIAFHATFEGTPGKVGGHLSRLLNSLASVYGDRAGRVPVLDKFPRPVMEALVDSIQAKHGIDSFVVRPSVLAKSRLIEHMCRDT